MTYRRLTIFDFKPRPRASRDVGPKPEFRWIPVEQLVVDERYQRPITGRGRGNIVAILECFDWRKFKPNIVVPVEDGEFKGCFAIIDGQHRSTAGLMHPLVDDVPCMVVTATFAEAAGIFADVNGRVTSMTLGQMFHARLASGEQWAGEVQAVCDAAGARILKAKNTTEGWKPGETMAVGTIERCMTSFGADVLRIAMTAIVKGGDGHPGLLNAAVIRALCTVVAGSPRLQAAGAGLVAAMPRVGLARLYSAAKARAATEHKPVHEVLAGTLAVALRDALDAGAKTKRERATA